MCNPTPPTPPTLEPKSDDKASVFSAAKCALMSLLYLSCHFLQLRANTNTEPNAATEGRAKEGCRRLLNGGERSVHAGGV